MFILGRINRIEKAVTQKFTSHNLIFGGIIGGNCLLPLKIARADIHSMEIALDFHTIFNSDPYYFHCKDFENNSSIRMK
jgi:hypothetical protein